MNRDSINDQDTDSALELTIKIPARLSKRVEAYAMETGNTVRYVEEPRFIPVDDLTQDNLNWLIESVNGEYRSAELIGNVTSLKERSK